MIKCSNLQQYLHMSKFSNLNFREMNYLYNRGVFKPGQLMETRMDSNSQNIRSDELS